MNKQMEFKPLTSKEIQINEEIMTAVRIAMNASRDVRIHSETEAYGTIALDYSFIQACDKMIKKKMNELITTLDACTETAGKIAEILTIVQEMAKHCVIMQADAAICIDHITEQQRVQDNFDPDTGEIR